MSFAQHKKMPVLKEETEEETDAFNIFIKFIHKCIKFF